MNIHGTGVDLIEIERIRAAAERFGDRFLRRVFSPRELDYAAGKSNPYPHLAARFAAKEAFIKAMAPLPIGGVSLTDIELVKRDGETKPKIVVSGKTGEIIEKAGVSGFHVSVSHDHTQAVATVLLTK